MQLAKEKKELCDCERRTQGRAFGKSDKRQQEHRRVLLKIAGKQYQGTSVARATKCCGFSIH